MASTNFTYSPTTGNGNTYVDVQAQETNLDTVDKVATIAITNGVSSVNVSLRQKFRPYLTQGPTSIPASGGSIQVYVYSEYDIVFRSVPLWITITSGNTTYAEGQRISASNFTNLPAVFTLTADPNTGDTRTIQYEGMNMSHYIGNDLITIGAPLVQGTQAAGNQGIVASPNNLTFDWNSTSAKTFTITSSLSWTSTIDDN